MSTESCACESCSFAALGPQPNRALIAPQEPADPPLITIRGGVADELARARRNAQADEMGQFYDGMVHAYECALDLIDGVRS